MTEAAWVTLVAVCGFIWGGFLTLVVIALRKEGRRPRPRSGTPPA